MPTQLEMIIDALKSSGRPMTADELGKVLEENKSGARNPKNSVQGLVSKNKNIFESSKADGVTVYSLAPGATGLKKDNAKHIYHPEGFGAFKAKCREMSKTAITTREKLEAETRQKLVLPFLRFLGYDDSGSDMEFEENVKGRHADIALTCGRSKIFVEIKKQSVPLDTPEHRRQLLEYTAHDSRCNFGILTNGKGWIFFYMRNRNKPVLFPIWILNVDIVNEDDFNFVSLFKKGSFAEKKMVEFSRAKAKKELDAFRNSILSNVKASKLDLLPDEFDIAILKKELESAFDKWRKRELDL